MSDYQGLVLLFSLITVFFEIRVEIWLNERWIHHKVTIEFNQDHNYCHTVKSKYHEPELNYIIQNMPTLIRSPGKKRANA